MTNVGLFNTDGGAVPLQGVEVTGEVLGAHARIKVRQRYVNTGPKPIEAVYTFPLPSEATLIGFAMTCAGRRLEGVVKEREEAFRTYDDAVWSGHGAALLDQERPNVFTAQVGNLLPNEETVVEIEYLERMQADEGAIRWMIPTLVAPRYIPGAPKGDRTGHGWAEPTDRVPDADRITPPIAISGQVDYGLKLDLLFDLGRPVAVESPSHAISVRDEGGKTRVTFSREEVALDRDVVLVARGITDGALTSVQMHRPADGEGYLCLTLVPDLAGMTARAPQQEVVFVIDTSGSMEGASLPQAKAALRLCLRHLREGDRFNVIEFNSAFRAFQARPVPFTQRTLEQADRWVEALVATGGTELLQPMLEAARQVQDGVIVLLTDGQVGNEDEILREVLAARGRTRMYSFGIGTNVSDVLLRELARRSGGAIELIHPGERIDEKVVAQFARAIAPRVTDVALAFSGVELGDVAPGELRPIVDGEPWAVFARIEAAGVGAAVISGKLDGKPWRMEVPLDLQMSTSKPAIAKLWASERIRELQHAVVTGRRAERMKERIVELAVAHGVASPYTSFVVVETRTGDRRVQGQPETRVVPVNMPAGWDAFERARQEEQRARTTGAFAAVTRSAVPFGAAGAPPPPVAQAPAAPMRVMSSPAPAKPGGVGGMLGRAMNKVAGALKKEKGGADGYQASEPTVEYGAGGHDSVEDLLKAQLANGLWSGGDGSDAGSLRATARALLTLLDAGVTTTHAQHGGQIKKAVEALLTLAAQVAATDPAVAQLALGVAWLIASGRRTRQQIEKTLQASPSLAPLAGRLADERALRTHLDTL